MQIEFVEAETAEDSEKMAREPLKSIIRGCFTIDFKIRSTALQVQRSLYDIMQQRGWGQDLCDAPCLTASDSDSDTEAGIAAADTSAHSVTAGLFTTDMMLQSPYGLEFDQ